MKHLFCCLALTASALADTPQQAAARIDAALLHDYAASQVPPGRNSNLPPLVLPPLASDTTFLRRACIDLAGRLPRPDEVRAFLASTSPDKRVLLTDALVKDPAAAEARFRMLAETFRVNDADPAVITWLRQAAADDLSYDQIITYLIGEGHMSRRDEGNAFRTGVETAYAVLGEDLHCAQCHDHAFNDHTQMESHQFAACFTMGDAFDSIRLPPRYLYRDGKPGDIVQPKLLRLTRELPPSVKKGSDRRMLVAQWLTQESSHRFATVAALRTWSSLFGMPGQYLDHTIGGSDPAPAWNEVHEKTDVPTYNSCYNAIHPNTITWIDQKFSQGSMQNAVVTLADEFRRCGHRIGQFQRILARTNAYGRSGIDPKHGGYLVPAPHIRRMPAEVVWDVLATEKSAQLPQVPALDHPLRLLGRGTREWSDESIAPISHELARFMINSPDMQNAIAAEPADRSTEDLFMSLLGRYPNGMEKAIAQHHRNESPQTATQDIAWALLNTREFMFRP